MTTKVLDQLEEDWLRKYSSSPSIDRGKNWTTDLMWQQHTTEKNGMIKFFGGIKKHDPGPQEGSGFVVFFLAICQNRIYTL